MKPLKKLFNMEEISCEIPSSQQFVISDDWYKSYFGNDYWDLVDLSCSSVEHTEVEPRFLFKLLSKNQVNQVLDLCCGKGRHLIPLSLEGYMVEGIDIQKDLIHSVNEMIKHYQLDHSHIKYCDVREIKYDSQFEAALFMQTSFGYFSDEENEQVIRRVHRALITDGLLIIDMPNRDQMLQNFGLRDWTQIGSKYYLLSHQYDYFTNRRNSVMTILDGSERRQYEHSIRMYTIQEMVDLLEKNGFRIESIWGDFANDQVRYQQQSHRLQIVANKVTM